MNTLFEKKDLLTSREKEVLDLLLSNYSNKEVAEKLFIDYETIRSHRKNIYKKLEVSSIMEVMLNFYMPQNMIADMTLVET